MKYRSIYKQLPDTASCYRFLEGAMWGHKPICPYCKSYANSAIPKENRYRCNTCKTTYSVTVGTIFHRTRLDIQKWLVAIHLVLKSDSEYGVRQLARDIEVTKDTAALILRKIKQQYTKNPDLLKKLIEYEKD